MNNKYHSINTPFLIKLLIKKEDSFLILKNNESDPNNLKEGWESPGGHLEKGEDIEQALFRELKEETGLTNIKIICPVHSFLFDPDQDKSLGGIIYLAEYIDGKISLDDEEHSLYKWATLDEIEKLEGTKGVLQEFTSYKKFINNIKNLF